MGLPRYYTRFQKKEIVLFFKTKQVDCKNNMRNNVKAVVIKTTAFYFYGIVLIQRMIVHHLERPHR